MRYQLRVTVHLRCSQGDIRRRDRRVPAYRQRVGFEPGAGFGYQVAVHRHFAEGGRVLRIQRRLAANRCGLQQQAAARRRGQVGVDIEHVDTGVVTAGQGGVAANRGGTERQVGACRGHQIGRHLQRSDRGIPRACQRCVPKRSHPVHVDRGGAFNPQPLRSGPRGPARDLLTIHRQRVRRIDQSERQRVPGIQPDASVLCHQGSNGAAIGQIQMDVPFRAGTVQVTYRDPQRFLPGPDPGACFQLGGSKCAADEVDHVIAIADDLTAGRQVDRPGLSHRDPAERLVFRGRDIDRGTGFDPAAGKHFQLPRIDRHPIGLYASASVDPDRPGRVQGCGFIHPHHIDEDIPARIQLRLAALDVLGFDAIQRGQQHPACPFGATDLHRTHHRGRQGACARPQLLRGKPSALDQQIDLAAGIQGSDVQSALGTGQPDAAARLRVQLTGFRHAELERPARAVVVHARDIARRRQPHILSFQRYLVLEGQQVAPGHIQANPAVCIGRAEHQVARGLVEQQVLARHGRQQAPADRDGQRLVDSARTADVAARIEDRIAAGGERGAGCINRVGNITIGRQADVAADLQAVQQQIAQALDIGIAAHVAGQRLRRLDEQRRGPLDPDELDCAIADVGIAQRRQIVLAQLLAVAPDDEHVAGCIGQRQRHRRGVVQVADEQILVGDVEVGRQAADIVARVEPDVAPDHRRLGLAHRSAGRTQGVGIDRVAQLLFRPARVVLELRIPLRGGIDCEAEAGVVRQERLPGRPFRAELIGEELFQPVHALTDIFQHLLVTQPLLAAVRFGHRAEQRHQARARHVFAIDHLAHFAQLPVLAVAVVDLAFVGGNRILHARAVQAQARAHLVDVLLAGAVGGQAQAGIQQAAGLRIQVDITEARLDPAHPEVAGVVAQADIAAGGSVHGAADEGVVAEVRLDRTQLQRRAGAADCAVAAFQRDVGTGDVDRRLGVQGDDIAVGLDPHVAIAGRGRTGNHVHRRIRADVQVDAGTGARTHVDTALRCAGHQRALLAERHLQPRQSTLAGHADTARGIDLQPAGGDHGAIGGADDVAGPGQHPAAGAQPGQPARIVDAPAQEQITGGVDIDQPVLVADEIDPDGVVGLDRRSDVQGSARGVRKLPDHPAMVIGTVGPVSRHPVPVVADVIIIGAPAALLAGIADTVGTG